MLPWSSISIPRQILPSPVYPSLQAHEKEPTVLRHAALMSHAGTSLVHSSKSEENKKIKAHLHKLCRVKDLSSFEPTQNFTLVQSTDEILARLGW